MSDEREGVRAVLTARSLMVVALGSMRDKHPNVTPMVLLYILHGTMCDIIISSGGTDAVEHSTNEAIRRWRSRAN